MKSSQPRHVKRIEAVPMELRGHIAENMKERIYATITVIAVITALWQTAEHHSIGGIIASIGGTVVALWLATLIAARVSHRTVYGRSMGRGELGKLLFTSSGLFAPVVVPVVLVLLSGTGLISMKTALLAGMVSLLLSLFLLSFSAGRRVYPNMSRVWVISLLETLVGVGVIVLKLAVGE